jgi:hypothetical protein
VVDAGLALALAVANMIGIRVALGPVARPDAFAYACGLTIAALALARRRWPLSVALATAWAARHRRWSLLVAAWFVIAPLAYALSPLPKTPDRR